ncbi:unnamed protein product [Cylicocyclus nassatus]|uniref:RING-type domain-containing protein n=1 Tax=Cylicocyclus nassatus TaxID=53992 RepID=A0AA36H496_CYLNA|nr:unnamed protein product [Cylicocyclus nassatus]
MQRSRSNSQMSNMVMKNYIWRSMNSVTSSTDAEDWLDLSDTVSLPSLSLDDVLNEVSHLDDEPFGSGLSEDVGITPSPIPVPSNYKLDNAVKAVRLESISHQLVSFRAKNGSAVAIAHSGNHTAVATSKGSLLIFDVEGRLERFWSGGDADGSASCVAFSEGGKHVAVGYSKGFVKVINVSSGAVEELIREAVQIGRGVLQVLFLDYGRSILTLDSGGSVFEIHVRSRFQVRKPKIRCIFSGCNGEVLHMRLLGHSLLALLTVSKILVVSTRMGGSIVCVFPLEINTRFPPLLDYFEERKTNGAHGDLRVCVGRGQALTLFRLLPRNVGTPQKAAVLLHKIQLPQLAVNLSFLSRNFLIAFDEKGNCMSVKDNKCLSALDGSGCRVPLFFSTSDYKGLTTGGNVSPAMQCLADRACYQSICKRRSHQSVIVLSHDELYELSMLSEEDQLELYQSRGDYVSACLYLLDIYRGRINAEKDFKERLPRYLSEHLRHLVDLAMDGCKEGKVSELVAHYKAYISILLTVSVGTKSFQCLYEDIWPRVERDVISRSIFLESLDEFVLDGSLESPPPALVSEYLSHLASEGHFSQLQSSVVRFPIECIDIHYVMSTCKQNGLYDGIIYVMNKAFGDYLSPLEEMLSDVSSFASHEVLSDAEVERGNRLLLYLHCCLTGHAYPYGTLPPELSHSIPEEVYRCITSLKGKDGTSTTANYPYLRLLLLFDAQQFIHMIGTCADAVVFQSENRLQRLIEIIGRLSAEMRDESALVQFLLLISQLAEISNIITPTEIVEDIVTTLMRMDWHHPSAEFAVVETLRTTPQIDRGSILRMATSPFRKGVCTFIYCGERKFVELIRSFMRHGDHEGIFAVIRQILRADLSEMELQEVSKVVFEVIPHLVSVNAEECARLVIECMPNYISEIRPHTEAERNACYPLLKAAFKIKRENHETFMQTDEDVEDFLFGIVFEGMVQEKSENLDELLQDWLLYWLPTGSRTDFCLNIAAAAECVKSMILLMEARGLLADAFEVLFKQIQESKKDQHRFVYWLDKGLTFCSSHSNFSHSRGWLLRIMRAVTGAAVEENAVDVEFRLRSLANGILENGSENSLELVECLYDYPSFKQGVLSDYSSLIYKILGTCSHETFLMKQLLLCINEESSEDMHFLGAELCRKVPDVIEGKCRICRLSVTKAAYIFSCGHTVHMECDSGERQCPCTAAKSRLVRNQQELNASVLDPLCRRRLRDTRDIFDKRYHPQLDLYRCYFTIHTC